MHVTCPAHRTFLDLMNWLIFGEQHRL
jgi:hypothetical protein